MKRLLIVFFFAIALGVSFIMEAVANANASRKAEEMDKKDNMLLPEPQKLPAVE